MSEVEVTPSDSSVTSLVEASTSTATPTFNCVIVGDYGTGKTTFIKRHVTPFFQEDFIGTKGVDIYPLEFQTSKGPVTFHVIDPADLRKPPPTGASPSQEEGGNDDEDQSLSVTRNSEEGDSQDLSQTPEEVEEEEWIRKVNEEELLYRQADCAIIIYDLSSRVTMKNLLQWHKDLRRVSAQMPIVICGNNADVQNPKALEKKNSAETLAKQKPGLKHYSISAKTNYNILNPFRWLVRKLFGDDSVEIGDVLPWAPPLAEIDPAWKARLDENQKQREEEADDDDEEHEDL